MTLMRYLRLVRRFARMSFEQQIQYRKSFFLGVLGKMIRTGVFILFFNIIFIHVRTIGGWDFQHALLITACFLTFESIVTVTYHRNFAYQFPQYIRKGQLDSFLVQPVPLLFHTGFRIIDFMDLISCIPALCLWWYLVTHHIVSPNITGVLQLAVIVVFAITVSFSLSVIVAATSFWSVVQTGLGRWYEQLFRTGMYPVNALGHSQAFIFTYIVPAALVGTMPAEAIRGILSWRTLGVLLIPVVVIAIAARYMWRRGLRQYGSVSS